VKRILSIFFVAVATFNLALFTVVPHHHHGAVMCATKSHCQQDNTSEQADNHTDSGLRHCATCIVKAGSPVTAAHQGSKCKCTHCDHPSHSPQLLPAVLFPAGLAPEPAALAITAVEYGVEDVFRPSADINRHAGLRAPPIS
jgi:hypothetical protein